jgi:hypothetical protein
VQVGHVVEITEQRALRQARLGRDLAAARLVVAGPVQLEECVDDRLAVLLAPQAAAVTSRSLRRGGVHCHRSIVG